MCCVFKSIVYYLDISDIMSRTQKLLEPNCLLISCLCNKSTGKGNQCLVSYPNRQNRELYKKTLIRFILHQPETQNSSLKNLKTILIICTLLLWKYFKASDLVQNITKLHLFWSSQVPWTHLEVSMNSLQKISFSFSDQQFMSLPLLEAVWILN